MHGPVKVLKWNHGASGRQHRKHRSGAEADQLAVEYEASGLSQT